VTTIVSAAKGRPTRLGGIAALIAASALVLGGCSANQSLIDLSGSQSNNIAATPTGSIAAPNTRATIALARVIGAPENVADSLSSQLKSSLQAQNVSVIDLPSGDGKPAGSFDYTLRGYVVAARERTGAKVSYIWDVMDPAGQRVKRLTGEQTIQGATSRDPWTAVSAPITAQIAQKTAQDLGAWLPAQRAPTPAAPQSTTPVASNNTTGSTSAPTPLAAAPAAPPAAPTQVANVAANPTTTGSLPGNNSILVVAPRVSGAPGDGRVSLASALSRELTSNGVALTNSPGGRAHRVNGNVSVGNASGGKQPIKIEWTVTNPQGERVGTVTQNNEIPAGSLDGAWGQTANAAAGAAAQGIMRLLKKQSATN
jgi:hypothetical protein